jgi:hypothetical protein
MGLDVITLKGYFLFILDKTEKIGFWNDFSLF